MARKFLSFKADPLHPMNFADTKKWSTDDGKVYKLISPDIQKDMLHTYMQIKRPTKGYRPDEKLFIEGIANANIVDRMEERLDPIGCIVQDYMKNPVLLAHHSYYHPVGQVSVLDLKDEGVAFGAWIGDPSLAELTDMQKEIRSLVAQGILKTVSVGFIPRKIRAPQYNDMGELIEPCVIEQWELLELSIVAVPCNQDSIFAVRDAAATGAKVFSQKDNTTQQSLNDLLKAEVTDKNLVVQTLIFDKTVFINSEDARAWARDHDFRSDKVDETDAHYRFRQHDPEDFDQQSFSTIDLTKGVTAVSGKLKDGATSADAGAGKDPAAPDVMSALQGIADMLKQNSDVLAQVLEAVKADTGADSTEPKPPAEPAKDLEKTIANLQSKFDKLVDTVKLLADKIK